MKRWKFSEEQVVYALRQGEAGTAGEDVCGQLGVRRATFYAWKKQYAHLGVSDLWWLRPLDRTPMEGAPVRSGRKECAPPEEEHEHSQPVAAVGGADREQTVVVSGQVENGGEINLAELLPDRPRALREDAPTEASGSQVVHAPQIAEHLSGGSRFGLPVGAAVEREPPALGLDNGEAEFVALPFLHKKALARAFAASSANNRRAGTSATPRSVRFCWRRLEVRPWRVRTGQIKSSSVWLSFDLCSVGNGLKISRSDCSMASSEASVRVCQSSSYTIDLFRKSFANNPPLSAFMISTNWVWSSSAAGEWVRESV